MTVAFSWQGVLAVGVGAAIGAWLRWGLAMAMNGGRWAWGTMVANLLGGLLVGMALAWFTQRGAAPDDPTRLFVMTGLLGGLTTFSTFSAEVFAAFARHDVIGGCTLAGVHLVGSLLLTAVGYSLARAALT
jgi:fluoride exporter